MRLAWEDFTYLTPVSKSGAKKLIRDELRRLEVENRKDVAWQRQNTQWKLTIAGMIIGWILGTAGILIGLFALLKK